MASDLHRTLALTLIAHEREDLVDTLAPPLRDEIQALLKPIREAPSGSSERRTRLEALAPMRVNDVCPAPHSVDPRFARLWPKPGLPNTRMGSEAIPAPRAGYRPPAGLREHLVWVLRAEETTTCE